MEKVRFINKDGHEKEVSLTRWQSVFSQVSSNKLITETETPAQPKKKAAKPVKKND